MLSFEQLKNKIGHIKMQRLPLKKLKSSQLLIQSPNNDSSILTANFLQLKQNQNKYKNSPIKRQELNIQQPQVDFSELQSSGLLVINEQKDIIKFNRQFIKLFGILNYALFDFENSKIDKNSLADLIQKINLKFDYKVKIPKMKQSQDNHDEIQVQSNELSYQNKTFQIDQSFQQQIQIQNKNIIQYLLCNNSFNQSTISNSFVNFDTLPQVQDTYFQTPDQLQITMTELNNQTLTQQINTQQDSFIKKKTDIGNFKQCLIPENMDQFYQNASNDLVLQDLIDFLIKSKPQIIESKMNEENICEQCQSNIDQQNKVFRSIKMAQNNQNRPYKIQIQQNYLVISLQRGDIFNQKKIIEMKIGCFSTQKYQVQSQQEKICQFCKQNNKKNFEKTNQNKIPLPHKKSSQSNCFENKINSNESNQSNLLIDSIKKNKWNGEILTTKETIKSQTQQITQKGSMLSENDSEPKIYPNFKTNDTTQEKQRGIQQNDRIIEDNQYIFTIEVVETNFEVISKNIKAKMDQFRQKMLCSISHELRTPLNCIISMLDILNMKNDIPEINKNLYINPALFSSYILLNIINDILDMAEVNRSGKIRMIFQEFSPINLCYECLNFIKLQSQQKNIKLEFECDEQVPQLIYTDLNKTRQVLLNLLSNALKFTQKGSVSIKLSYPYDQTIQVDVIDTGCGIPEQKLRQIFRNFSQPEYDNFQNNSSNSFQKGKPSSQSNFSNNYNTKNAGLGLNISYLLASCLGYKRKLTVKSEVGKGSTFTFFISNRSQQQKGCTIQKINQSESNNSLKTKQLFETEGSMENIYLSSIQEKQQSQKEIEQGDVKRLQNKQSRSNSDINIKFHDSELHPSQIKETPIFYDKQIQVGQFDTYKIGLNNNSGCQQANIDKIERADDEYNIESDNYIAQLFPEDQTQQIQRKPIKKNIQAVILQNNFNKTALQIIQQASNLHNQIYSQRDFSDENNNNYYLKFSSGLICSPNEHNQTFKLANSKKLSISDDENNHLKIPSAIQSRLNQKDIDQSPSQRRIFNYPCNSALNASLKISQIQKQVTSNSIQEKSNKELIVGNKPSDKSISFQINQEDQQSKIKIDQKAFCSQPVIESCDVLNESFEKKSPKNSFNPQIGVKPKSLSQKVILQNAQNLQGNKYNENACQSQLYRDQNYMFHNFLTQQQEQVSSNNLNPISNLNQNNSHNSQNQQNQDEISKSQLEHSQEVVKPHIILQDFKVDFTQSIINFNKKKRCQCSQILIVDDNEFNLFALEVRLQMYLFQVDKVTSGLQALEYIKQKKDSNCCKKYALIFMDIDMPEMNGYETTEEIIKLCHHLKINQPIISACSAYIQENEKQKAFKVGMKYYITKPINTQSFENVLNQVFLRQK